MVLFGIKANNTIEKYYEHIFDFIRLGEANAGDPIYACKFAKMIEYWRQIWNQRTNGITDLQFPFGFVQVPFIYTHF